MTGFTAGQVAQLLRPINESRVLSDGKGHSHVSQQDVTAHLIRIFGFGGFDVHIDGPHLVFEQERLDPKTGKPNGRWDVCYRAKATLIIKVEGREVCRFDGSATGVGENQKRGDGHDLAMKSAESVAKKRAATNLGDQFGLSLYNKGQLEALVRGTLIVPEGAHDETPDMQEGVQQQVSLGNDEIDREPPSAPAAPSANGQHTDHAWLEVIEEQIKLARSRPELVSLANEIRAKKQAGACEPVHEEHLWTLGKQRQAELDGKPGLPRNKDGSISRSQLSDEERSAAGLATRPEAREMGRRERETLAEPKKAERTTEPNPDDPWQVPPMDGDEMR